MVNISKHRHWPEFTGQNADIKVKYKYRVFIILQKSINLHTLESIKKKKSLVQDK